MMKSIIGFITSALLLASSLLPQKGNEGAWTKGSYLNANCPPFVFLTLPLNQSRFGADVSDQFSLGDPGRQMMFMDHQLDDPVLLFPRPSHKAQGLINSPALSDGSVHEPHVYWDDKTDQYWVFFSYANDLRRRNVSKPCEIYALNITDAVMNPTGFDPDNLPISKVTSSPTTTSAITALSFNPTLTPRQFWVNSFSSHFATNTSPCVIDEEHGTVLYFASNERRAAGLALHAGDLVITRTTVSLANQREIQHFGTTSLIGFSETPNGVAGSYQSSIESGGQWSNFEFHSDEGFWDTLSGYGNQVNITDHNQTTVAMSSDIMLSKIVVARYYLNNNESFGALMVQDYFARGTNDDNGGQQVRQRTQFNLFPDIAPMQDVPSKVGKFGMPAGGRVGELFATYSTNCSNNRTVCSPQPYHAVLVALPDITKQIRPVPGSGGNNQSSFNNPAYNESVGVHWVLSNAQAHAFSMRPILKHHERFIWGHRVVNPLFGKAIIPPYLDGMPVAKIQAGPIYNTDVKPYRLRAGSYDPTTTVRNGSRNQLELKLACLTKDVDPSTLRVSDIIGMRIFITDPTVQRHYTPGNVERIAIGSGWGYLHHNGSTAQGGGGDGVEMERVRLLGDVPIASDGTLAVFVPSDMPLRFNLLHKDGTILAAHRGHHSFNEGQLERRCTGCHNHVSPPLPATGLAFQETYQPFDSLNSTGKFEWNQNGDVKFTTTTNPTEEVPEFKRDIWPLLNSECGSCHDSAVNSGGAGLAKFNLSMPMSQAVPGFTKPVSRETAIWAWLHNQRYINRRVQAAKSPLAWHFVGVTDDDTLRLDGETNARYKGNLSSKYWITTDDGTGKNPHAGIANRAAAYKVIEWIDGGAGIDHDTVPGGGLNHDGYQIALNMELRDGMLSVGFWDPTNNIDHLDVLINRTLFTSIKNPNGGNNGVVTVNVPGLSDTDQIQVEAVDKNDNHSRTEQSVKYLLLRGENLRDVYTLDIDGAPAKGINAGQTVTFNVSSNANHAGDLYIILGNTSGWRPGFKFHRSGVFNLLNHDPLLAAILRIGFFGALDADGNVSKSVTFPANLGSHPEVDIFWQALMFNGTQLGKSNMTMLKLK